MQPVSVYATPGMRRRHDRIDLSRTTLDARLIFRDSVTSCESYSVCQLLNLSFGGMCLQGEDFVEVGGSYRFVLDLAALLGSNVEVTAQIAWKRPMDGGLCYAGAVFTKSSAPWLGPDED